MFKVESGDGKARTGILTTRHGKIETPFFMPVATKMTAKLISPDELHFPDEKPKYVMGLGSPADVIKAVGEGIDIFDSCYPTRCARRSTAFTRKGRIGIERRIFQDDFTPFDEECDCLACRKYTKAYVHHLVRIKEPLGMRLMTLHNLRYMQRLIEDARTSIKEGSFESFSKDFLNQA
jgi:queuine tRNA-ribosyltransferase